MTSAEGQDYLLLALFSVSDLLLVLTEASSKRCACSLHATSDSPSLSTWSVAYHREGGKRSIQSSDKVTDQIFNGNLALHSVYLSMNRIVWLFVAQMIFNVLFSSCSHFFENPGVQSP